jgi:hypothetical protein
MAAMAVYRNGGLVAPVNMDFSCTNGVGADVDEDSQIHHHICICGHRQLHANGM